MKAHEFHFVINKHMINLIENIKELKDKSFSYKIKFIIYKCYNFVEYYHYNSIENHSKYEIVKNNNEEVKHVHIYLKEDIYRRLKQIHQDLNYYSIGQLVRLIIKKFLEQLEMFSFDELLIRLKNIGEKLIFNLPKVINRRKKIRQLSDKKYYTITYNKNFSQIFIKLKYKSNFY